MKEIKPTTVSFCIPIVSENLEELREDLLEAIELGPDFIEIRRDYFNDPENEEEMLEIISHAKEDGPGIIYTFRSDREGGQMEADETTRLDALRLAAEIGACDYVDIEQGSDTLFKDRVKDMLTDQGIKVILSKHDFKTTPNSEQILKDLESAAPQADVVKAAYTATSQDDLANLIRAGQAFRHAHPKKPLILIAMGPLGVSSRLIPELFFSNLTFVTNKKSSAPGQLALDDVLQFRSLLEENEEV